MAVATADFDNDGLPDIFVAGVNRNILYRNLGGGRFADVTAKAGLSGVDPQLGKLWSISAGWFDYDNDGWLDLFVSNYVAWDPAAEPQCGPPDAPLLLPSRTRTAACPNQLFHNNRDGTFTDVSRTSGIAAHIGKGMGVSLRRFRSRRLHGRVRGQRLDAQFPVPQSRRRHVSGDGTRSGRGAARRRQARSPGWARISAISITTDCPTWSSRAWSTTASCCFAISGKRPYFEDVAQRSGLQLQTRPLTGWSLGMCDFDNDGWRDLFFAVSHFPSLDRYLGKSAAQPNRVFRNVAGTAIRRRLGRRGRGFPSGGAAPRRGLRRFR